MRCKRCGNTEDFYFFNDRGTIYCRKCVNFGRLNINEEMIKNDYVCKKHRCRYQLKYPLTKAQEVAIKKIEYYLNEGKDILVYAVAGAGKTELVMESIKKYLNAGKKVGFAISRRQVVLEIKDRMQEAFKSLKVVAVCEGFTDTTDGDLIVCTMHQLYRYYQTFDLLIMDEVDAFPYKHNELLENIAMASSIDRIIYLTATPDEAILDKVHRGDIGMVELFQRPHGHQLVVPIVKYSYVVFQYINLMRFLFENKRKGVQVLIFVPTILLSKKLSLWLNLYFKVKPFTSQTSNKEEIIQNFREYKYDFLVTTTVLERGITIKGVNVVIVHGDHKVFDEASLIQIVGRVGRSIDVPSGDAIILAQRKTVAIQRCMGALKMMNDTLNESL